jgi:hypothetical protein
LNNAVRTLPMCKKPVGAGENRMRISVMSRSLSCGYELRLSIARVTRCKIRASVLRRAQESRCLAITTRWI